MSQKAVSQADTKERKLDKKALAALELKEQNRMLRRNTMLK